jgi:hypothetical protein
LYVPTETAWLACRRCWGLTYQSRTQNNYKDSTACAGLSFSHRSIAQMQTSHERERRHAACVERWAERRKLLKRTGLRDPEQRALHLHAIAVDCGERLPPSSAEARPGSVARNSATPAERAIEDQLFTGRS